MNSFDPTDWKESYNSGMDAIKLPNGNLLIPKRAESDETGVVGDGMVEVEPGTEEYEEWLPIAADKN